MHIGILGGGFTGCLLAAQLLRRTRPGLAVTLIESSGAQGRGVAYGTQDPEHLLNVRAANMGAFPEDPRHFLGWLQRRFGAEAPAATDFVPRRLYGEYVADVFGQAISARGAGEVSIVSGVAAGFRPEPRPAVVMADGRDLAFDRLALCFGNLPPGDAPGLTAEARASGNYVQDPWRPRGLERIEPGDEILIVGSGLTMVDVVQTLAARGHKATIQAVSRHGLLPRRHEDPRPISMEKPEGGLSAICRALREKASAVASAGHGWRDVMDAMRPWTAEVWRGLDLSERRRFLRHLRSLWDVHRHRLAPKLADTLDSLRTSGQLAVIAGRVGEIAWKDGRFDVAIRRRGTGEAMRLRPAWVINCTGPQTDYARSANPFVRGAVLDGSLRVDALGLGLDVTEEGAVIDARGRASRSVFALGPPTRGAFWEVVAVPDLRRECARMADVLLRP